MAAVQPSLQRVALARSAAEKSAAGDCDVENDAERVAVRSVDAGLRMASEQLQKAAARETVGLRIASEHCHEVEAVELARTQPYYCSWPRPLMVYRDRTACLDQILTSGSWI